MRCCVLLVVYYSVVPAAMQRKGVCWLDTAELDIGVLSCTWHPHGVGAWGGNESAFEDHHQS